MAESKIHVLSSALTVENLLAKLLEQSEDIEHVVIGVAWKTEELRMGVAWSSCENGLAYNALLSDMIKSETLKTATRE